MESEITIEQLQEELRKAEIKVVTLESELEKKDKIIEANRWIPVSEGPPDDKREVDIYLDNGNRVTCFNFVEHWEIRFAPLRITHWKPIVLPEVEIEKMKGNKL